MAERKSIAGRKCEHVNYIDSDVHNISSETGLSREEIWLLIENFGRDREKVMRIAKAISESRKG